MTDNTSITTNEVPPILNIQTDVANSNKDTVTPSNNIKDHYTQLHYIQIIGAIVIGYIGLKTTSWGVLILCIVVTSATYFANMYFNSCPFNTTWYVDIPSTQSTNNICDSNSTGYIRVMEILLLVKCMYSIKGVFWLFKLNLPDFIERMSKL
jgi:hypothetical protein